MPAVCTVRQLAFTVKKKEKEKKKCRFGSETLLLGDTALKQLRSDVKDIEVPHLIYGDKTK
jgi:hypothetical protein